MTKKKRNNGYNVLEILIVLCIITIFSQWSLMNYQTQIAIGKRREAELALLSLASALEEYALTHDNYNNATLEILNIDTYTSQQRYRLQIEFVSNIQYRISAVPNAAQSQWDIACDKLIYNSEGEKTISGHIDVNRCWSIAS